MSQKDKNQNKAADTDKADTVYDYRLYSKRYKNLPPLERTAYLAKDANLLDELRGHLQTVIETGKKDSDTQQALLVLFRRRRMDGFRLLYQHGASLEFFDWSDLHRAVAVSDLQEVKALATGDMLETKDRAGRSPYILACRLGEVEKAAFLRPLSSDAAMTYSNDGCAALHTAAQGGHVAMLKWLLAQGDDVNSLENFGGTPLLKAVQYSHVNAVKLLLDNGADTRLARNLSASLRYWKSRKNAKNSKLKSSDDDILSSEPEEDIILAPVGETTEPDIMWLLIKAGIPFEEFSSHVILQAAGAAKIMPTEITPEMFERFRDREFGTSNPQRSTNPLYREIIRTRRGGWQAGSDAIGPEFRSDRKRPVWSFDRFGRSKTLLPDGHYVLVAGEHEDHYDPDFCIYNDVTALDGKGRVEHYIYPRDIFPTTDFHSATLVDDGIWLIGNRGYVEDRREGVTQVLRLSLKDFSVEKISTTGENPGWISDHSASLKGREIEISGGKVEPGYKDLTGAYALDLDRLVWKRLS